MPTKREKAREAERRYYEKSAKKIMERRRANPSVKKYQAAYRERNREKLREDALRHYIENRAEINAKRRMERPHKRLVEVQRKKRRRQLLADLVTVLRAEMPSLIKEFGL